jgi:HSP20 family protein
MSLLFPAFQEISPLFRLADELERTNRSGMSGSNHNHRSFSPRFDVKETKEAYELHGELPGIEQEQINIEWSDNNTLTISGQTEHRHEFSNTGQDIANVAESNEKSGEAAYHKPTIEDEGANDEGESVALTKTSQNREVAQADDNNPKYWVTERSFGSFHRTFQFPSRVDYDAVQASLKQGILTIKVPKAKTKEPRRVQIA